MTRMDTMGGPVDSLTAPTATPVRWFRTKEQLENVLAMLAHFVWHRKTRASDHMWSIPVDYERDFDCILSDAINELVEWRERGLSPERAAGVWQPIATCPREVTRALLYWPTFALNEDYEQSDMRHGDGLVAESCRVGGTQWENDHVAEHFEDEAGFGYGDPTHWMPLPPSPESSNG
jgi:hypothetical protein